MLHYKTEQPFVLLGTLLSTVLHTDSYSNSIPTMDCSLETNPKIYIENFNHYHCFQAYKQILMEILLYKQIILIITGNINT